MLKRIFIIVSVLAAAFSAAAADTLTVATYNIWEGLEDNPDLHDITLEVSWEPTGPTL